MTDRTILLIVLGAGLAAALAVYALLCRLAARVPLGTPLGWILWQADRLLCRLVHRASFTGTGRVPDTPEPGGLIIVSNHTSPVDPLLIQSRCRFVIRWMMASDMMVSRLDWLWRRVRIIPVERNGRDSASAREAIRHVRGGGVLGIFPEGGLPRPKGELRPFHQGAGLIVARTKAPVLLVWISGTPETTDMFRALVTPSRARVRFVERIEFGDQRDAEAITRALRERLAEVSGWPLNDEPVTRIVASAAAG